MNRQFPCILKGFYTYFVFDKGSAIPLDENCISNIDEINFNDKVFKNITAEYLANTYGEVKSKEHAEFIVKLAEVNGIEVKGKYRTSSAKVFSFRVHLGAPRLILLSSKDSLYNTVSRKQITIPLPPDCESVDETPFEVISNGTIYKLSEGGFYALTGNGKAGVIYESASLDNLMKAEDFRVLSFVTDNTEKEDSEWPKVGDEVTLTLEPSINHKVNCIVRFIGSKHIILTDKKGREYSRKKAKAIMQKPKTQEQELRDEVIDDLARISQRGIILIGEFLLKYNITKKPQ